MSHKTIIYLSIITIAIGLIFLANGLILAWSPPTQPPPAGNTLPPLNIGSEPQTKSGGLGVAIDSPGGTGNVGFYVGYGNVGIGTIDPQAKLDVAGGDNSFNWGGDNSDSGYIRIGDLQIAWGVISVNWTSNPQYVDFPADFISPPTVTTSCPRSGFYTAVGENNNGPTATGFNFFIRKFSDGNIPNQVTDGHWIAIGQWR